VRFLFDLGRVMFHFGLGGTFAILAAIHWPAALITAGIGMALMLGTAAFVGSR
jgi:hypothetical protein